MQPFLDHDGVDVAIATRAEGQRGIITLPQLLAVGLSHRAISYRAEGGRLIRLHQGVFAVGHAALTREARWLAAVLACGEGAALGIRSAATHWRARDGEGPLPDVIVPGRGGRGRPGIATHRMRLHPDDATTHQGIRVTTPERTLIDMANVIEPEQLARAFREAQFLRRFDPAAMRRALARKPSRAVAALMADFVQTRSPLEDLLLTIIDRHRIPRPRMQHPVLGHHLDFVWPEERVVVETDGWEGHGTRTAFQADRTLSNRLQLAGWLILRFTDADVKRRRERVAAEIRTALAARRGRLMDV